MTKTFCDRCGEEIKSYDANLLTFWIKKKFFIKSKYYTFQLCQNCYEKEFKWISNKED